MEEIAETMGLIHVSLLNLPTFRVDLTWNDSQDSRSRGNRKYNYVSVNRAEVAKFNTKGTKSYRFSKLYEVDKNNGRQETFRFVFFIRSFYIVDIKFTFSVINRVIRSRFVSRLQNVRRLLSIMFQSFDSFRLLSSNSSNNHFPFPRRKNIFGTVV